MQACLACKNTMDCPYVHDTLTPVGEEDRPNENSVVANLFGDKNRSIAVDSTAETIKATVVDDPDAASHLPDATAEVAAAPAAPVATIPTPVKKKAPQPMASPEVPIFANFTAVEKAFENGYNTEADAGPEEYNAEDEAPVFEAKAVESNAVIVEEEERATKPIFVALSSAKIAKLTIAKRKH
jgi:hypothetical protein